MANKNNNILRNIQTFNDYYIRLKLLALSIFKWENMPEGINTRFLEETLYTYGFLAFHHDEKYGYMLAKCNPASMLNYYDEPVSYQLYGTGYQKYRPSKDCVIIRNNTMQIGTHKTISLFAERLANAERTIDVNINQQKTPSVILTDEKQRLTFLNLIQQYDANAPFIYGNKNLDVNSIKAMDIHAPYIADKLQDYKHQIWNECMSFLGINNSNTDKRERLNTDEVNSNNDLLYMSAQNMLLTRQESCDIINKTYKLEKEVKVSLRTPLLSEIHEDESNEGGRR